MKSASAVFALCLLLVAPVGAAQEPSRSSDGARAVLVRFVELSNSQSLLSGKARKLLIDDAAQWDMPSFGKLAAAPDKVLRLDEGAAVGRLQAFGTNNHVTDLYFYLKYADGWKISTMRSLAMTGLIEELYLALKAKKSPTQEEADVLANFELVLASDQKLREWFHRHTEALNRLVRLARSSVKTDPRVRDGSKTQYIRDDDKEYPEIASGLKRLHLSGINIVPDGNFEFVIGGMLDNTVGFLYAPTNTPPRINPSNYIWVEELSGNWYLFRTT